MRHRYALLTKVNQKKNELLSKSSHFLKKEEGKKTERGSSTPKSVYQLPTRTQERTLNPTQI